MGSYIAKQPNGLLCRFSTVVDAVTHINMTEEDYIEFCAEQARMMARYDLARKSFIKPFDDVLKDIRFYNVSHGEWKEQLKKMGYNVSHEEWEEQLKKMGYAESEVDKEKE